MLFYIKVLLLSILLLLQLLNSQSSSSSSISSTTSTIPLHIQKQQQQQQSSLSLSSSSFVTTKTNTISNDPVVRHLQDNDDNNSITNYANYSCNNIYEVTPKSGIEQCYFSRTCNGNTGVWAPIVFCMNNNTTNTNKSTLFKLFTILLYIVLIPISIVWMILLFRMLGSTAEEYFSPSLEMLSIQCKLPPRFAGVTLLALGNGAADVSATIAAITNDPNQGYLLSLGALTGAAMFISTIISATVIFTASIPETIQIYNTIKSNNNNNNNNNTTTIPPATTTTTVPDNATTTIEEQSIDATTIPVLTTNTATNTTTNTIITTKTIVGFRCRGAFIRDIIALSITVITVYYHLSYKQYIDHNTIIIFISLYGIFVTIVLVADIYHRSIVIPRIQHNVAIQEINRQSNYNTNFLAVQNNNISNTNNTTTTNGITIENGTATSLHSDTMLLSKTTTSNNIASNMISALSNYEGNSATHIDSTGNNNNNVGTGTGSSGTTDNIIPDIITSTSSSSNNIGIESDNLVVLNNIDRPIILHGVNGLLQKHGHGHVHSSHIHGNNITGSSTRHNNNDDDNTTTINGQYDLSPTREGMYYRVLDDDINDTTTNNNTGGIGIGTTSTMPGATSNTTTIGVITTNMNIPLLQRIQADNWYEVLEDGRNELILHCKNIYYDIIDSTDISSIQKLLLVCELPITAVRQCTVPIPCDGFYVKTILSISLVLSPLWFILYLYRSHHINIFTITSTSMYLYFILQSLMILVSLCILRYGPPTTIDGLCPMPFYISVPIALYGFFIAATWIDTIADALVNLLNFIGIICYIPGPIIGLTLLAWGNSMGDLSANVTMSRKGLSNMAMTACYAGPIFNILIGLGFGFLSLSTKTGIDIHPVTITPSIRTGFFFLLLNNISVLYVGLIYGKGIIPYQYGYVSIFIYICYLITSITLQYSQHDKNNDATPEF